MSTSTNKTITLPFKEFLDYLITYKDKVELKQHPQHADLIEAIDSGEVWTHVQRIDILTDKPLPFPIVWRKADWIIAEENYLRAKKESAARVKEWNKRIDNINNLCRAIQDMTGLPREMIEGMAQVIVIKGDDKAASNFGVKLKK